MKISSKAFNGIDESQPLQSVPESASNMMNFVIGRDGSLIKRGGTVKACECYGNIDAIWSGNIKGEETLVFVSEGRLYRISTSSIPAVPRFIGEVANDNKYLMFDFNGCLYIKSSRYYGKYDGETLQEVEGYIPCVAMSCTPAGEGVILEQINILSDKRRQLFSGTGTGVFYKLAEKDIDEIVSIKVDGVDYGHRYSLDSARGTVSFEFPPAEGLNNVEIIYSKAISESDKKRFFGCNKVMLFGGNSDGRAFFWGNSDYPNYRFHTELADGIPSVEYFPINAFTVIGNSRINCIVQQYDRQLIFTENEAFYSYCELKTDSLGNTYSSFPVFSLNGSKGCIIETDGCIIDNRPITLCNDGLNMWESTSVENEKNAVCFSSPISESLSRILEMKNDIRFFDFQANREFFLISRQTAYVFNYGIGAWYKLDGFGGLAFTTVGRRLYFANGRSIYVYGRGIGECSQDECVWQSCLLNNGSKNGFCDVMNIDFDVHVSGGIQLVLGVLTTEGTKMTSTAYVFPEKCERFTRLSFRPAIRRCMPYSIFIESYGEGELTIHGLTVTTREKERSDRRDIL